MGPFFPRARGDPMRPDGAAVDTPELPVEPAGGVEVALERLDDAVPQPLPGPAPEARVHRGPRPVALGEVAPRAPGRVAEEHAVEDEPVIPVVRPRGGLRGEQRRDAPPLRVGELMPMSHARRRGNRRATLSYRP